LGELKLEGRRFDGEPFWFRGWFPSDARGMVDTLQRLSVGEDVVVWVAPTARNGRVNYRVERIAAVSSVSLSVPQAA
jgi:hypothetical protein